ncbi:MAG: sensor histidine kinase [Lachnospirales bacterium]
MKIIFKNFQIRIIIILIISITPIMLYELYNYNRFEKIIEKQTEEILENNLDMVVKNIDNIFSDMFELSNILYTNTTLINELENIYNKDFDINNQSVTDIMNRFKVENEINSLKNSALTDVETDVIIICTNGAVFSDSEIHNKIEVNLSKNYKIEKWYPELKKKEIKYSWIMPYKYRNFDGTYISLVRKIYNKEGTLLGYIMLNASEINFIKNADYGNWDFMAMYNSENYEEIFAYKNLDFTKNHITLVYNENKMWTLIARSDKDVQLQETKALKTHTIRYNILVFIIFSIIVSISIIIITQPLKHLIEKIRKSNIGQYKIDDNHKVIHSNIHSLANTYDYLFSRIEELANKSIEDEKKEAELKYLALKSQINPHFLFNTLNTIKFSAMINGDEIVAEMIAELGALLEATLKNDELISIVDELLLIESYLYIQNLRFNSNYTLESYIAPEMKFYKIPSMLLQPIVENSIMHGYKNVDSGVIKINCYLNDGIIIDVIDEGKGFEKSEIENKGINFSNIGLSNVNERIQIKFGDLYGVSIKNQNKGSKVTIRLPND